jgi:hypothetical protein
MIRPILANGMILIWVYMLWQMVLVGAGILALVALVFSIRRRARKFVLFALFASFAPFVVPLLYASPLSDYGSAHEEPVVLFGLSILPPLLSGVAVYISGRSTQRPRP